MPDEVFYFRDSGIPETLAEIPADIFLPIRSGMLNETQVRIEYENAEKHQKRNILPEVLFRYSEDWYVAAYCFARKAPRTFRFDKILSAEVTNIKETSYGVAADIRANGIPWNRPEKVSVKNPAAAENDSALWVKLEIVPGEKGPEICAESSNTETADLKMRRDFSFDLVLDAERGNLERIREDLAGGADINFLSGSGHTPFTAAASQGDVPVMKYLVEHGADPFARMRDGSTALMEAVLPGNSMEAVRYLTEELMLEVETENRHSWSPLFLAVLKGRTDMVEYFLAHGADISRRDRDKKTLLMTALEGFQPEKCILELAKVLIDHGVDIHAQDKKGRTALYYALEREQTDCIRLLISAGLSVSHFDKKGVTPLLFVCQYFNDMKWRVPEHYRQSACDSYGLEEKIRLLLNNGADVCAADRQGVTPLMLAHGSGLTCLLKAGACVNAFDRTGKTVAMYHALQFDELELLQKHGADLDASDFEGNNILLNVPAEYDVIHELVTRFGLKVTEKNNHGDTLLHRAAREEFQDLELLKFLIRHGADPFAGNDDGDIPADHFPLRAVYRKYKQDLREARGILERLEKECWKEEKQELQRQRFFFQEQGTPP